MTRRKVVIMDAEDYDIVRKDLDRALFYLNDLKQTGYCRKGTVPEADLSTALINVETALLILEGKND